MSRLTPRFAKLCHAARPPRKPLAVATAAVRVRRRLPWWRSWSRRGCACMTPSCANAASCFARRMAVAAAAAVAAAPLKTTARRVQLPRARARRAARTTPEVSVQPGEQGARACRRSELRMRRCGAYRIVTSHAKPSPPPPPIFCSSSLTLCSAHASAHALMHQRVHLALERRAFVHAGTRTRLGLHAAPAEADLARASPSLSSLNETSSVRRCVLDASASMSGPSPASFKPLPIIG
jgi:hypothetical protein